MCGPYNASTWLQIDLMIRKIALISYYCSICSLPYLEMIFCQRFWKSQRTFLIFPGTDGIKGQMPQRSLKNDAGLKRFVWLAVATKQFTTKRIFFHNVLLPQADWRLKSLTLASFGSVPQAFGAFPIDLWQDYNYLWKLIGPKLTTSKGF